LAPYRRCRPTKTNPSARRCLCRGRTTPSPYPTYPTWYSTVNPMTFIARNVPLQAPIADEMPVPCPNPPPCSQSGAVARMAGKTNDKNIFQNVSSSTIAEMKKNKQRLHDALRCMCGHFECRDIARLRYNILQCNPTILTTNEIVKATSAAMGISVDGKPNKKIQTDNYPPEDR